MSSKLHLSFIGLMGSGKTKVAQTIAEKTKMCFVDLDKMVEERAGINISQIFETQGEEAFRSMESQALGEALANPKACIVATGGGIVLDKENRKLLRKNSTVIWLKVSPKNLESRISKMSFDSNYNLKSDQRPLLVGKDVLEVLTRQEKERTKLYKEIADLILDGDTMGSNKLANMAWRHYEKGHYEKGQHEKGHYEKRN